MIFVQSRLGASASEDLDVFLMVEPLGMRFTSYAQIAIIMLAFPNG
jgi:hypothetical protein